MIMDFDQITSRIHDENLIVYFHRLQAVFADMDRKYGKAADHYGFQCRGCQDNCCLTRFYHHTFLEYLFVLKGLNTLGPSLQHTILAEAESVCRQTKAADEDGLPVRLMCPLNIDGMCSLYHFRPMICRLHGIPHELHKPGQPKYHGPGCSEFDALCSHKPYYEFDRTRFYFEMAGLENEFKRAAGLTGRIRLTIADMLVGVGQSA